MPDDADDEQGRRPTDDLLDVIVYAPIAFALDARTVVPELAQKGRQHARAARTLGELAVNQGIRWLQSTCAEAMGHREGTTGTSEGAEPAPPAAEARASEAAPGRDGGPEVGADTGSDAATDDDAPGVETLAIPEYDSLAASQVVQRLAGLAADELEAIRRYELANRGRRTILGKIAQLQATD